MTLMIVGIVGGFIFMFVNLLIGAIVLFGSFFLVFAARKSRERPNSITIYPDRVEQAGTVLDRGQITRVEYGKRSQWTGNTIQQGEIDPMQIRLWINDRMFHVVSLNTWETQINHKIKMEIEDAISAVGKEARADHQEPARGKAGDYGMPEY